MAQKLIINTRCPFCGNEVEKVSDGMLKSQPGNYDVEYVVTHLGYKRYLHTSCWNRMIAEQKKEKVNA